MQGQYHTTVIHDIFLDSCIVWLCQVPTHMSLLGTDVKLRFTGDSGASMDIALWGYWATTFLAEQVHKDGHTTPHVVIFVSTLVKCFTGTCTMSPCIVCRCQSSPMCLSKISTLLLQWLHCVQGALHKDKSLALTSAMTIPDPIDAPNVHLVSHITKVNASLLNSCLFGLPV